VATIIFALFLFQKIVSINHFLNELKRKRRMSNFEWRVMSMNKFDSFIVFVSIFVVFGRRSGGRRSLAEWRPSRRNYIGNDAASGPRRRRRSKYLRQRRRSIETKSSEFHVLNRIEQKFDVSAMKLLTKPSIYKDSI
jgi:hypothetical protein